MKPRPGRKSRPGMKPQSKWEQTWGSWGWVVAVVVGLLIVGGVTLGRNYYDEEHKPLPVATAEEGMSDLDLWRQEYSIEQQREASCRYALSRANQPGVNYQELQQALREAADNCN